MAGNLSLSRLERVYMAVQGAGSTDDFQTAASLGNNNYVRHIKAGLTNEIATLIRRDKTGARTRTLGVRGRGYGKWSYEGSLAPSGVNGTTADFDPLMQSVFGQAAASANGGLQYSFTDLPILAFTYASFRQPSTLQQRIAYGCVTQMVTFNIGQDIAEFTAEGEARFVLNSDYTPTSEEAGLGSVSYTEPSAPVSHGGIIAGFTGSISIGGNDIARIRTAQVKIDAGNFVIKDTFGHYIPDDTEGDVRIVTLSFTMYDTDEAAQQTIRNAAITKTPVDANLTVGTVAGSIVNFFLKNVQLASYQYDDSGRRFSLTMPESPAFGTSITSKDEIKITLQ